MFNPQERSYKICDDIKFYILQLLLFATYMLYI
jgi:hypothetical protein